MDYSNSIGNMVSIDTQDLDSSMIQQLYELELDLWARSIGEYIFCDRCNRVWNKNEAFQRYNFSEIGIDSRENVSFLEGIIGGIPPCPCCNGETKHIYDIHHRKKIQQRHTQEASFLTVMFDTRSRIVGVMDGFYTTLEEIYQREFSAHFHTKLLEILQRDFHISPDSKVLTISSLGTDEIHKSMKNVIHLIKAFVNSLSSSYDDIGVIVEGIKASPTFSLFEAMGATSLDVGKRYPEVLVKENQHPSFELDILYQHGGIGKYKRDLSNLRIRDIATFQRTKKCA